jgi:hypothetical protein
LLNRKKPLCGKTTKTKPKKKKKKKKRKGPEVHTQAQKKTENFPDGD